MIVTIALNRNYIRPTIDLVADGTVMPALIDTGAVVPITALSEVFITKIGGRLEKRGVPLTGIGRCVGDLFRVDLSIGQITYRDLPIVRAIGSTLELPFILSAAMFTGFTYTIDDIGKTLTIDTHSDEIEQHIRTRDLFGRWRVFINDIPYHADEA